MKIGIVGNQFGWTYRRIKEVLKEQNVYKSDIIISGGAIGVDSFAQHYAKEFGCQIRIVYPDPSKSSPERYFDRNYLIALYSDVLIAFDKKLKSSGTKNTIKHAKKLNKKILVFVE